MAYAPSADIIMCVEDLRVECINYELHMDQTRFVVFCSSVISVGFFLFRRLNTK